MPAGVGPTTVDLIFLLFLLLPGLGGVKTSLRVQKELDTLTRLDKIVMSFVYGLGALSVSISFYRILLPEVCDLSFIHFGNCDPGAIMLNSLDGFTVAQLVAILLAQSTIAAGLGLTWGTASVWRDDRIRTKPNYAVQPWQETLSRLQEKNIREMRYQIRVRTRDGRVIEGRLKQIGGENGKHDLLLGAPKLIADQNNSGQLPEAIDSKISLSYVHYQSIDEVHFYNVYPLDDRERKETHREYAKEVMKNSYDRLESWIKTLPERSQRWARRKWRKYR